MNGSYRSTTTCSAAHIPFTAMSPDSFEVEDFTRHRVDAGCLNDEQTEVVITVYTDEFNVICRNYLANFELPAL